MMGTTYIYVVQALYTLSDIGLQKSLLVSDNSHSSIPVATLPHVWAVNWGSYITMINEVTGNKNWQLSDKKNTLNYSKQ